MPSERIQRRIDSLLDQVDDAIEADDWERVETLCANALALDPDNADALAYVDAAERAKAAATSTSGREGGTAPPPSAPTPSHPDSIAGGRYRVERFLR